MKRALGFLVVAVCGSGGCAFKNFRDAKAAEQAKSKDVATVSRGELMVKVVETGTVDEWAGKGWSSTPFQLPAAVGSVRFSALIGVVFGLYPAISASRLDPIVALRSE